MDQDGDESEELRRDRERFVTAALAFTLKHSRPFLREFWKRICRVPGDPRTMPRISREEILLEPPAWADLQLESKHKQQNFVWVVEVKVGAKLQDKQNPASKEYLKPKGYGRLFKDFYRLRSDTNLRYVVLRLDEELTGFRWDDVPGIQIQERGWSQVAEIGATDNLTGDLFESLAQFGIYPFTMKQIEGVKVTAGLSQVGKAAEVIHCVRDWLGVGKQQGRLEAYSDGDGCELGMWINIPPRSRGKELTHVMNSTGAVDRAAWIGYIVANDGSITRDVWICCGDAQKRAVVQSKLERKFEDDQTGEVVEPRDEPGVPCVVVRGKCNSSSKLTDWEWFKSIFALTGTLANRNRRKVQE